MDNFVTWLSVFYTSAATHPQISNNPEVEGILGKNDATVLQMPGLWC